MKLVKKAAKVLVLGFVLFNMVRPLAIPKLPPIEMLSQSETTVELS